MKEFFLAGRVLLGGFLLFSGAHHFTNAAAMSQLAADKGVPLPLVAILVAGLLLLGGGVTLILGIGPKLGIAALVLFFVPVTLTMHAFWREQGMARAMDLINFTKNVGLMGAIMMLAAIPEPWPLSAEIRGRLPRHAKA